MNENENKYLEFLRFAIDESKPQPSGLKQMDWQGLYDFAKRHAVLGVAYHGIQRLDASAPRPDSDLEFRFYGAADRIRRKNIKLNMVAAKLSENMLKEGFRSCIIKGQGNSLMYPDPMMRQSGDIDIWLDGSREAIFKMVKRDVHKVENQYHHIDYPIIQGVEIEIHYVPSFFSNLFYNRRLQKYYDSVRERQFCNQVELPDELGSICRPTDDMNRIFQLSHVFKHFVNGGVGLRQMIDYYYLLRRGISEEERKECQRVLKHLNMLKFARGMMYVLQEALGLETEFLIAEPNEKLGRKLLYEVLTAGNFGRSDQRMRYKGKNKRVKLLWVSLRPWRYAREFPAESLVRPLFLAWHQVWKWNEQRKYGKD